MSGTMKALKTSTGVAALMAGGPSLMVLVSVGLLGTTNAAMAINTDCGNASNITGPGDENVACGVFNNAGTSAFGNNSIFGSNNSTINGSVSTAIGAFNVVGFTQAPFTGITSGLAVGDNNKVQGDLSNAVGHQNVAYGDRMNILGSNNVVGISGSPTISADSSVVGNSNTVTNTGVSVGFTGSYIFGNSNNVNGDQNIAIGLNNDVGTAADSSRQSVLIGDNSSVNGYRSIVLGSGVTVGKKIFSDDAVAIGSASEVNGRYATAIGSGAQAQAEGGTALGTGAAAYNLNSTAIGNSASVTSDNSVALGANSVAAGIHTAGGYSINGGTPAGLPNSLNGVVSVGGVGAERQIQNVAAGVVSATSTDAINGSQLYAVGSNVNSLGSATAAALGGGSTYSAGGGVSTPNYVVQGNSYNNVGTALGAVDSNLNSLNNSMNVVNQQIGGLWQNVGSLQRGVQRGYEGTAVAIAHTSPTISRDAKFGISGKWSNFRGQNALGVMAQARINNNIVLNASVGAGLHYGGVGVGAGGLYEW